MQSPSYSIKHRLLENEQIEETNITVYHDQLVGRFVQQQRFSEPNTLVSSTTMRPVETIYHSSRSTAPMVSLREPVVTPIAPSLLSPQMIEAQHSHFRQRPGAAAKSHQRRFTLNPVLFAKQQQELRRQSVTALKLSYYPDDLVECNCNHILSL
jgi:hypothetical protein